MLPAFLTHGAASISFRTRDCIHVTPSGQSSLPIRRIHNFRPRVSIRCSAGATPRRDQFADFSKLAQPSPPPPPPPPPGREDEFSDVNDGAQEEDRGQSVATLDRERSFDTVLQELTAIQQDGPRNVAILGTRYTSYLHQQIIELLTYANVLVGNHVFTSGAGGTNAAVIRGALRAEKPELLTVVLPQSLHKQPKETQEQVSLDGELFG